jgi:hypothetical protein
MFMGLILPWGWRWVGLYADRTEADRKRTPFATGRQSRLLQHGEAPHLPAPRKAWEHHPDQVGRRIEQIRDPTRFTGRLLCFLIE